MALHTRPPTCAVPWPLILIEGPALSGKSYLWAELTASPQVGRCYALDLGDGSADQYGDISGTITYDMVVHDGTWATIISQIQEVHAEAARARAAGEKPVVLAVDSGSQIWEMLKSWGGARSKGSVRHQRLLTFDPNAEIRIPNNIWDDIHDRHNNLLYLLMTFPGIAIITARGRETILNDDSGDPVPKTKTYKVECQRDLPFSATVWIRLAHDTPPTIIGARSKYLRITHGKDEGRVVPDLTLDGLIFQTLRCSPDSQPRDLVQLGRERLPEQIRDDALATTDRGRLRELFTEAAHPVFAGVVVDNEAGEQELLTELIVRRARAGGRAADDGGAGVGDVGVPAQAPPPQPPSPPASPTPSVPQPDLACGPRPSTAISETMLDTLRQMLASCGIVTPDDRLMVMQVLTGKRILSSGSLTSAMGAELIGLLAPIIGSAAPNDALRTLMQTRIAASMAAQAPAQERSAA